MSGKDVRERTEPPTPRRLRKLREKGQVAKSRDLASAAALTGVLTAFCIAWPWYLKQCKEIVDAPFPFIGQPFHGASAAVAKMVSIKALYIIGPLLLIIIMLAVVACMIQIGVLFSIHPVIPKMERLNPAEGLKRLFSLRQVIEGVKAVIKTLMLSGALYYLLKDTLQSLVVLPFHGIGSIVQITARLCQYLFLVTIIVFLMMSLVDVLVQKRLFSHENKMSKDDVKRDHKDSEGDPLIKSRRRSLHKTINAPEHGDDHLGMA